MSSKDSNGPVSSLGLTESLENLPVVQRAWVLCTRLHGLSLEDEHKTALIGDSGIITNAICTFI
jgi:hypothetical protein